MFHTTYRVPRARLAPGPVPEHHRQRGDRPRIPRRRRSSRSGRLFYGSYPITPASDILHQLSGYKHFGVKTFQAEDEIAAIGAAIGASYGGALALTGTSGPGVTLKSGGHGPRGHDRAAAGRDRRPARRAVDRHAHQGRAVGPAPGAVRPQRRVADPRRRARRPRASASRSRSRPSRIALKYMTPVVYLSDAFVANGAEPWQVPSLDDLPGHLGPERGQGRRPVPALRPRPGDARPPVGRAGHRRASSTASAASRRPTAWATSATTPRTTTG